MTRLEWEWKFLQFPRLRSWLASTVLLIAAAAAPLYAADNRVDFDSYKLRVSAFWFYSQPSGDFQGSTETQTIDLQKDLGFEPYSTVVGRVDWKFTRKNHIYFMGASFDQTRSVTLNRTVTFQGQTFDVGVVTKANLSAPVFAPGYQYDIIRRRRGHLGIAVQFDLYNAHASLMAAAQVTSTGVQQRAVSAHGSLLAPIPVGGPDFRFYLTNSPRLYVAGNALGMYFFGYGNYVSSAGYLGLTLTRHLAVNAGYQLGSRLVVNNKTGDRIGILLTQQGAIVGLEAKF